MSEFSESSEEIDEARVSESGGNQEDGLKSPSVASSTKHSSSDGSFDHIKASQVIEQLSSRCQELQKVYDNLSIVRRELSSQIEQSMDFIRIAVDKRKDELLHELDTQCELRLNQVRSLLYQFETRMQKLLSIIDMNNQTLDNRLLSENDLPSIERMVGRRGPPLRKEDTKKLLNAPILLHPSETDSLIFYPNDLDKIFGQLKSVGLIGLLSNDPGKTYLENYQDNLVRCDVDEKMTVNILGFDKIDRPIQNMDPTAFSGELKVRESRFTKLRIYKEEQTHDKSHLNNINHIRLTYSISNPGLYDLSVKVFGEHIRGSPYIVWCKKPPGPNVQEWIESFNQAKASCLLDIFKISSMKRYASMPLLNFWDFLETRRIAAKGITTEFLFSFDLISKPTKSVAPTGIVLTKDQKIVIVDSNNGQIFVYSDEGKFLTTFGESGSEPGFLQKPIDVAETINGNYLISDMENHCVNVFSPKGKYISRFGQRYLLGPKGLVVDSKGRILVADPKGLFVCMFKPTGKFINRFGVRGTEDSQFLAPSYIAVNKNDEIFVSDSMLSTIKVFDQNGLFLRTISSNGMLNGELHNPAGIIFDRNGRLIVCDQGNSRIQVFDVDGSFYQKIEFGINKLTAPVNIAILADANRLYALDNNSQKIYAFFYDQSVKKAMFDEIQQD